MEQNSLDKYVCQNCKTPGWIEVVETHTQRFDVVLDAYGGLTADYKNGFEDNLDSYRFVCGMCGREVRTDRTFFCGYCKRMHRIDSKLPDLHCLEEYIKRLNDDEAVVVYVSEKDVGGWKGKEGILLTASNDAPKSMTPGYMLLKIDSMQRNTERGSLTKEDYDKCQDGTIHRFTERDCTEFLKKVGFFEGDSCGSNATFEHCAQCGSSECAGRMDS